MFERLFLFYNTRVSLLFSLLLRFFKSRYVLGFFKRAKLDVKYCWEFERLYFLASKKTMSIKKLLLIGYYTLTPTGRGLAWACSMESTYRVISLLYFREKHGSCNGLIMKYLKREYNFTKENIEKHSNNNHILFNYVLLVLVARHFDEDDSIYQNKLIYEIGQQFHEDGSNFEGSTAYHILTIECLSWLVYFEPSLEETLFEALNVNGAVKFIEAVRHAEGVWLIGDNDSSICVLGDSSNLKMRDKQIEHIFRNFNFKNEKIEDLYFSKDFGLVSKRFNSAKLLFLNVNAGQNGKSGHNHNDFLSICLALDNTPIILDPGVCTYSFQRDFYRSIHNHSSPFAYSANKIYEFESFTSNFSASNISQRKINLIDNNTFVGECSNEKLTIIRTLLIKGKSIEVSDYIKKCELNCFLGFNLFFVSGCNFRVAMGGYIVNFEGKDILKVYISQPSKVIIKEKSISMIYGKIEKTLCLNVITESTTCNWSIEIL
ncbi:heparinase II/III domain-containing protein [Pseudoalteromonas galatheae]|uniref:heparinase II/III domain-containing protein n=1 Tax=Pseudoalteromonas galatheae TaxID=579562 RepID=UPI0030CFE95A